MCLPASTAALKCSGRNPGRVVRITTSTAAIEHLLIGVQSDKLPLVIDIDFALATFADIRQRTVQPIAEHLAHGPKLHVAVGRKRLRRRSRAAATTTDEADL